MKLAMISSLILLPIFANRAETSVGTLNKYMQRLIANAFVHSYNFVDLFVNPINSLFEVNRPNFAMLI